MERCGACKNFVEVTEEPRGPVLVQKDRKKEGHCMHSPPQVVPLLGEVQGRPVMQLVNMYPRVSEENGACAQYQPRVVS